MAAALIAALFAMGVFSATGVGADAGHNTDTAPHMAQLSTLEVAEGAVPTSGSIGNAVAIFPEGFTSVEDQGETVYKVSPTRAATHLAFAFSAGPDSRVSAVSVFGLTAEQELGASTLYAGIADPLVELETITEEAGASGNTLALAIDLTKAIVTRVEITVVDDEPDTARAAGIVGHDPQTYTVTVEHNTDATNSTTAGDTVRLNLQANLWAAVDDEISIDLSGFDVPSGIDSDQIVIVNEGNSASPSDVSSGNGKITFVVPDMNGDEADTPGLGTGTAQDDNQTATLTTVRISNKAGIKNPDIAGMYGIKISDELYEGSSADTDANNIAEVVRTVSVSPTKGGSGAEVTVSGKGYSGSTARVYIDNDSVLGFQEASGDDADKVLGPAPIAGGSFEYVTTAIKATSQINAYNLDLGHAVKNATYTVTQSISVSPSDLSKTDTLTITLKDWIDLDDVDTVSFTGGTPVTGIVKDGDDSGNFVSYEDGDNDNEYVIKVKVPADVDTGTIKVSVIVDGIGEGSATINVAALELDVTPTSAVPGQTINIRGSDFSAGEDIKTVTVGGKPIPNLVEEVDANGNIDISVKVPKDVAAGDRTIEVEDIEGRVGEADLTVPTPTISIDPDESRIGESVTVTGTGFSANDLVLISYGDNAVGSSPTDMTGNFEATITVPNNARIGKSANITAVPQVNKDAATVAEAVKHSTPDPTVSLNPSSAAAGQTITVGGDNYKPFTQIEKIEIGDTDVTPSTSVITNALGSFSGAQVTVPLINPNRYLVKATAKDDGGLGNEYLEVASETVSIDPADVFADLIADGSLSTVWHLDASTQSWTSFSTNPALADFNDLTVIRGNQVYVLIMSAAGEFQGKALFAGTNQVFIP